MIQHTFKKMSPVIFSTLHLPCHFLSEPKNNNFCFVTFRPTVLLNMTIFARDQAYIVMVVAFQQRGKVLIFPFCVH